MSAMPKKIHHSAILHATANMTDGITEVQRQEALLKTGALQSAIFNSANFSSIATDAKGVIQILVHRTIAWVKDNLSSLIWLGDERWKAKNCTGTCWA